MLNNFDRGNKRITRSSRILETKQEEEARVNPVLQIASEIEMNNSNSISSDYFKKI